MIRVNKFSVSKLIFVENVLISTFDKSRLEYPIKAILEENPEAVFYSTGGSGVRILEILKGFGVNELRNFMPIEKFTGSPEMEGGLVKTLHPKIFAGLLAERGNPDHENYLEYEMAKFGNGPGVFFDVFIGNFYPFNKAVSEDHGALSAEVARCNIDIGGPSMAMATAKNWHGLAILSGSHQYSRFIDEIKEFGGCVSAKFRFELAVEAMKMVADYRQENFDYFRGLDFERDVIPSVKPV